MTGPTGMLAGAQQNAMNNHCYANITLEVILRNVFASIRLLMSFSLRSATMHADSRTKSLR